MTVSGSGGHNEAMAIADELTNMIKSGTADPGRMAELVKKARELGDEARKASIDRRLDKLSAVAIDRYRTTAHRMPKALALNDPTALGQFIARAVKNNSTQW